MEDTLEQFAEDEMLSDRAYFTLLMGKVEGGNELVKFLETTDFYDAPASVKYHSSFQGGLLRHTINVYNKLDELNTLFGCGYSEQTLIKTALCHELNKVNFFEHYMKNEKIDGQWVSTPAYKTKDAAVLYLVGDAGFTSYMLASRYIPFTDEEIVAICNYGKVVDIRNNLEIQDIMNQYPLTLLLHMADMGSMYIIEHE